MCGIAGFVGSGSRDSLDKMAAQIHHRGPDAQGVFFDDGVGLVHARLSIIDLTPTGAQPMFNKDRTVGIVFNGEIYNFQILRKELEGKGRSFRGRSDTEVILALYEEHDEACFEKMVGMFAIAIYDFKKEKLILARDRMGEKPLYWTKQNEVFVFASELGAIMDSGLVPKDIDLVSLNKYLLFDYVPTPGTILKDVYKLEPATCLVYEKGGIRKQSFWSPPEVVSEMNEEEALLKLDELFRESVSGQLVSDAPLGVFLSGGIDSSTVAWYAQQDRENPIDTFSMGFKDASFDESVYAREVATLLGTNHYERIVTAEDALNVIETIPDVFSEPVADASVIPTLMLSEFARGSVKVSLGGDGGDELFAGYPTFQAEQGYRLYELLPDAFKTVLKKFIYALPAGKGNFSLPFTLKKFISIGEVSLEHRHSEWLGSFPEEQRAAVTTGALRDIVKKENVFENIDTYTKEYKQPDSHNRLLYTYLRTYMMDEVLVKVDRASMHHALEVRAPMLDYRIAEFVFGLPYKMKYRNFRTKRLLKELMRGKLPDSILFRKKKGFGVPLSKWLREDLEPLCEKLLSKENLERQGLFDVEYVAKLKKDHIEEREDNRKQLWNLMIFQMWYNQWIEEK